MWQTVGLKIQFKMVPFVSNSSMCRLNTGSFLKFSSLFYAWMNCQTTTQNLSLKTEQFWTTNEEAEVQRILTESKKIWLLGSKKMKEPMNNPRILNTVHAAVWSRLITGIKWNKTPKPGQSEHQTWSCSQGANRSVTRRTLTPFLPSVFTWKEGKWDMNSDNNTEMQRCVFYWLVAAESDLWPVTQTEQERWRVLCQL